MSTHDMQVDYVGGVVPFQVWGTYADRYFYFRERHDNYTLTVGPPGSSDWEVDDVVADGEVVAAGHRDEICHENALLTDEVGLAFCAGLLVRFFMNGEVTEVSD